MPNIYLRNPSPSDTAVNEVKIGIDADGACDPSLRHLGNFTVGPRQHEFVTEFEDTTDVYYKSLTNNVWTHKIAWRFDSDVYIDMDLHEGSEIVDPCRHSRRIQSDMMTDRNRIAKDSNEIVLWEDEKDSNYIVIGRSIGSEGLRVRKSDLRPHFSKATNRKLIDASKLLSRLVGLGAVVTSSGATKNVSRPAETVRPLPNRDSERPVLTLTSVGDEWSRTGDYRKIFFSKRGEDKVHGKAKVVLRSGNSHGDILNSQTIRYGDEVTWMNPGQVFVQFECVELGPDGEPCVLYVHIEWD